MQRSNLVALLLVGCFGLVATASAYPQGSEADAQPDAAAAEGGGQSRESMANDSTASQWTFQLAYEVTEWRDDEIAPGIPRPPGNRNFWQFRFVAPLSKDMTGLPWPILPRLTLRNNEADDGSSGRGNAELFALIIPVEWATGRWGIGPQINFPADNEQLGTKAWRYGIATAALQRLASDKILTGILVQQAWGKTDSNRPAAHVASPLSIQPVFNYSLPKSYYVNIGETAFSYDWEAEAWLIPLGVRFGHLWIGDEGTWNFYGEYRTSVVYKSWPGSAPEHAFRLNVAYTIPI